MIIRHRLRRAAIALATATIVPLALLATTTPAEAATTYKGRVTTGVNVRSAPTSYAPKVGSYAKGATITIQCKVYGPTVSGNSLWYKLANGRWVSARYVANIGAAPRFCGDGHEYTGRVSSSTSLAVRSGPHTSNTKVSSAPRGATLSIVCKVDSQSIDGNRRWYQLTGDGGGQWVSARYVTNVGSAPPYC
ncbi:SH3 domain-containing protein [Jiangella aurantiaca]|uniref:SH3 domain-containing protein n=1 Tax=Jiangella aurantiaca TaxID=2530373 RepID=A0A4R5AFD3_9ACTN|nr:SH3 domain-containing protein [Jiangella aurantiaca]TDD71278.1 SH3 domain-containing protein [Jiangella aurantiaca]